MKDRIVVVLGLSLVVLVLISMIAYITFAGTIGYGEIASVAIVAILVSFATYIMWDRARNISKGLPAADERLKNINYKAGYYGFIAAILSAVLAPALADVLFGYELEGHLVTVSVVIAAGFAFAASYLYLARKGS
ncbi:MAG: hypothetical protein HYY22_05910 [Thaumarchaeota archaeon]|nr:hypothetical protein [Nitrososphaerota archaeon]